MDFFSAQSIIKDELGNEMTIVLSADTNHKASLRIATTPTFSRNSGKEWAISGVANSTHVHSVVDVLRQNPAYMLPPSLVVWWQKKITSTLTSLSQCLAENGFAPIFTTTKADLSIEIESINDVELARAAVMGLQYETCRVSSYVGHRHGLEGEVHLDFKVESVSPEAYNQIFSEARAMSHVKHVSIVSYNEHYFETAWVHSINTRRPEDFNKPKPLLPHKEWRKRLATLVRRLTTTSQQSELRVQTTT